jgi:hypothetical protein
VFYESGAISQWDPAGLTWSRGQARPSQAEAHACGLLWPGTSIASRRSGTLCSARFTSSCG